MLTRLVKKARTKFLLCLVKHCWFIQSLLRVFKALMFTCQLVCGTGRMTGALLLAKPAEFQLSGFQWPQASQSSSVVEPLYRVGCAPVELRSQCSTIQ